MKNKIYPRVKTRFLLGTIAALFLLAGCDGLVYDDLSDCPMGVYVRFYEITAAKDTMTVFPREASQQHITLLVFDGNGTLAGIQTETFSIPETLSIPGTRSVSTEGTDRPEMFVPIAQAGQYSFVAWGGTPGGFVFNNLDIGSAKKDDIVTTLGHSGNTVDGTAGIQLYYGMFKTHDPATGDQYTGSGQFGSNAVIFKDPGEYGSQYADILVGMVEQTRRIRIHGVGLGLLDRSVDDLKFVIRGRTGSYTQDGALFADGEELEYTSLVLIPAGGDDLTVYFDTLGRIVGTDGSTVLEISFTDKAGNEIVYTYRLMDLIRADPRYTDIDYDLAFEYDLEIRIDFYISASGEVMDWTLVSKDIELTTRSK